MTTGVTVRTSAVRLVRWKQLAMMGDCLIQQLAVIALLGLALAATVPPAQAASSTQNPAGFQVLRATQTTVRLGWPAPSGAMPSAYLLYQMNGVQMGSGCQAASSGTVICRG